MGGLSTSATPDPLGPRKRGQRAGVGDGFASDSIIGKTSRPKSILAVVWVAWEDDAALNAQVPRTRPATQSLSDSNGFDHMAATSLIFTADDRGSSKCQMTTLPF